MRLIIVMALITTGLFITGSFAAEVEPKEDTSGPEIIDPYFWDFGVVKEGELLKAVFEFKNTTEETITITDVRTSCGCTASAVEKKILKPGETTFIRVEFDSSGYSGPTRQFVYVNTDSQELSVVKLEIKAEVVDKRNDKWQNSSREAAQEE